MDKSIVLKPRMSEKAYGVSQERNVYIFDVPTNANKQTVSQAVQAQFEVGVASVRIMNSKGKAKRTIASKGRKVYKGRNNSVKKAYVTLKSGQSLPFFAAVEEAEEKEKVTQEKVTKAIEKQTAKEAKPSRRGIHLPGRRSGSRGGDK
jgi:large subunit ribosomal protein L23